LKFFAKNFNSNPPEADMPARGGCASGADIYILNLKHGHKSANRKIKKNAQIQIASGAPVFSLRQKARLYEKVRFVSHMFSRGGQSRIDSGRDQKQLVSKKIENEKVKMKN